MTKSKETLKMSEDGKCSFSEKKHIYKVGKKKLTSVTQFLKEYFSEFDATRIAGFKVMLAKKACNKEGKPYDETCKPSYWKNEWKKSAEHGTRTHSLIEAFVLNRSSTPVADPSIYEPRDIAKANQARHWLVRFFDTHKGMTRPEYILYNEKYGLAGQIDLLVIDGKEISIVDYKTNSTITQSGYKGAKAKAPIEDLEDCSLTKYSLQLSLYAYMLEKQGYKVKDLILLHLKEDGLKEFVVDYAEYKPIVAKLLKAKV